MASTAAGHAYTAAADEDVGNALLAEMERESPAGAQTAAARIEANRRFLRGTRLRRCLAFGAAYQRLAVPMWSPQIKPTLSSRSVCCPRCMNEKRLHKEVAPRLLELGAAIAAC